MEQFVRVDMAVIIILSGMNRSANPHSKSETGFILINGQSKYEQRTRWQWLTQRSHFPPDLPHHQRLSYAEKKRVLSGLQTKLRTSSNFKIREGFSLKQNARIASTPSSATLLSQKRYQPYVYLNPREEQADIPALKFGVDQSDLLKRMTEADQRGNRILALVSVRRVGLRYRLNHSFVEKCGKCMPNHRHDLKDISGQAGFLVKQFGNHIKELYYYSPKGIPINTYQDILQENALIADIHPKLSFSQEITWRVFDLVGKISQIIATLYRKLVSERKHSESGDQSGSNQQQAEEIYDHQRIKDVELYVDRLSQDPQFKLPQPAQIRNELSRWYDQKYQPEQNSIKEGDKNLLFQSKCHYPQQIINRKMLKLANQKVEQLPSTCNKHKFIPQKIDLMMEHIRREQTVNAKASVIPFQPITKRDMLARLDRKNSLLSTQNIPYLIEKYGLNRYEIYNLYNLYKAFEKIAIMRNPNLQTTESVAEKGIDRQTFEAGLKGLDMNPGEELIKNICHFGDFISWQQFIKIISISLRKTPEEKLSAILKGISSFDDGYLSKHQISLMVGNSLHKLFDHQEAELKDYFTNMAMSEFDPNNTGRVEVELLKTKVLNRGSENLNMVSFLILNT